MLTLPYQLSSCPKMAKIRNNLVPNKGLTFDKSNMISNPLIFSVSFLSQLYLVFFKSKQPPLVLFCMLDVYYTVNHTAPPLR